MYQSPIFWILIIFIVVVIIIIVAAASQASHSNGMGDPRLFNPKPKGKKDPNFTPPATICKKAAPVEISSRLAEMQNFWADRTHQIYAWMMAVVSGDAAMVSSHMLTTRGIDAKIATNLMYFQDSVAALEYSKLLEEEANIYLQNGSGDATKQLATFLAVRLPYGKQDLFENLLGTYSANLQVTMASLVNKDVKAAANSFEEALSTIRLFSEYAAQCIWRQCSP